MLSRLLTWLILAPLSILAIVFCIANRHLVTVRLDPLPWELPVPLFAIVFVSLAVGVLIGGWGTWFKSGKHRKRAREASRQVGELEREIERSRRDGKSGQASAGPGRPALPGPAGSGNRAA